ncbi:hypothetical protein O181_009514 [Austropuccinia psidii MF-1]|uniref:Uncharacterized protein n=1 Tax=Austropuccinia psidii MF-1 TaxID=1389203 RepID=A0A9Q3BPF4_9BASI|nr:hypothetical protein [Austropuccinia psidii MF-1]
MHAYVVERILPWSTAIRLEALATSGGETPYIAWPIQRPPSHNSQLQLLPNMFLRKIAFPALVIISSPSLVFSSPWPSTNTNKGVTNHVPCWRGYGPVGNSTEKIECNTGKSVFNCTASICVFGKSSPAYEYMYFSDCFYTNGTRNPWDIPVKSYRVNADNTIYVVTPGNTPFICPPKNNQRRPGLFVFFVLKGDKCIHTITLARLWAQRMQNEQVNNL